MRFRLKTSSKSTGEGTTGRLNTFSTSDCLVYFDEGDSCSFPMNELEVQLSTGEWIELHNAFKRKSVITNNYNTCFFEPTTKEDRERGYTL